jgi:hypothetical protein
MALCVESLVDFLHLNRVVDAENGRTKPPAGTTMTNSSGL